MSIDYVFLLSSERSGTNLITRMIDAHPEICGPSPTHMIRTFSRNILRYGNLQEDANWNALLTDVVEFLSAQLGHWETSVDINYLTQHCTSRSLGSVIRSVYEREMEAHGKCRIFVKENQVYSFAPFVLIEWPECQFVLLLRDPRDVALSWKHSANHPGGVRNAMDVWIREQEGFVALTGFLSGTGRVSLVRYEDLIAEPKSSLGKIARHIGVDYSPSMLAFHEDRVTRHNAERIRNWANLDRPVISDNSNKYKNKLSEEEIRYIETRARDYMRLFGYNIEFEQPMDERRLDEFKDTVTDSQIMKHGVEEKAVRERRLSALHRIIDRPLMKSSDLC